jgi:hypothetical protein
MPTVQIMPLHSRTALQTLLPPAWGCIITSGRICLGGHLVRFWTSHQNKTLPMADQSRAPHVQAEASGGLPSVEEVPPAHSVGRGRQTTFSWKKTLETDSETHDRAAERRQNINQGQRFYHARCPPLNCQTSPTFTRATSCSVRRTSTARAQSRRRPRAGYAHALGPRHSLRACGKVHPRPTPASACAVAQAITIQFESGKVGTYELESLRHLWPVIEVRPRPNIRPLPSRPRPLPTPPSTPSPTPHLCPITDFSFPSHPPPALSFPPSPHPRSALSPLPSPPPLRMPTPTRPTRSSAWWTLTGARHPRVYSHTRLPHARPPGRFLLYALSV